MTNNADIYIYSQWFFHPASVTEAEILMFATAKFHTKTVLTAGSANT